ncbi:response regulator [Pseudobacteroides cellulosolvens]|uniref:Stage 0 sporulation protein A homolog n=1 Tax=Pseudobacteroides cellulosolvens ATCC 35603 = DSM 2933 TaxID=398512 RepID=A0A0L6JVD8_9FIRM|nr:response regulator [Pseudobacteroides cellulosolvens]KNY29783.1 response regulator receiver protein [Pseudobacteroides cellulosolvens ATCC 35603 = DSM 2933]
MENSHSSKPSDILLVDDTAEHIEAAVLVLKNSNFRIRVATSGDEALNLIYKQKPDLILLDIYMPQMDGFELCKLIKNTPDLRNIPIIFLTSYNDEESIRKGFDFGGQDYVVKPYNASELLARVNTHLILKKHTESLKEANQELDSFCYTVSHDLKAPLLSLNKLVEILAEDHINQIDENGKELISNIQEKSIEIINTVDRLLEFSKMCEMKVHYQSLNLSDIILDVYNDLKSLESHRKIILNLEPLPFIIGDSVMIRLLILNILSNAFKYTRHKETAIIDVGSMEVNNEYIFSVSDNGAGFDMKYSSRLFGVFQRLHSKEEFEGSGVGLAICQRILKRHNGKSWMKGEIDKGATFYFSLPKNH